MSDKVNGARIAWATIKLTGAGQRPAVLEQVAAQAGLAAAKTERLLGLVWRDEASVRDGLVYYHGREPAGPRRYRTEAGGAR